MRESYLFIRFGEICNVLRRVILGNPACRCLFAALCRTLPRSFCRTQPQTAAVCRFSCRFPLSATALPQSSGRTLPHCAALVLQKSAAVFRSLPLQL